MNNTIGTVDLLRIFPPALKYDPKMTAAAQAIAKELQRTSGEIRNNIIYARIDELDEAALDVLAHDLHVLLLGALLKNKRYTLSDYNVFKVWEPKERTVMSNSFKDKVVQHSLCDNVIEPALLKTFIRDNYAGQRGKGTLDGLDRLETHLKRYFFSRKAQAEEARRAAGLPQIPVEQGGYAEGWVLKCDVGKYFYTIQHEIIFHKIKHFVKDPDVLWLITMILDSTENPGIPIGNQSSQWFAVLYLSELDHFITEKLGIKHYGRYMDDFYLIHPDKEYLQYCRVEIEKHVAKLGLYLNAKTNIFPLKNGLDFLGFHTYLTDTGKVIRKVRRKSKNNEKRKLVKMKGLLDAGKISMKDVLLPRWTIWNGGAGRRSGRFSKRLRLIMVRSFRTLREWPGLRWTRKRRGHSSSSAMRIVAGSGAVTKIKTRWFGGGIQRALILRTQRKRK